MKVLSFKKMSSYKLDYYTVWSDYLMAGSMVLLLIYLATVYSCVRRTSVTPHLQRFKCIVRGILIFTAVNVVAVLLISAHMDSYNFDKRLDMNGRSIREVDDEETELCVPLKGVTTMLKSNFIGHVLPILLAILLLFVLKFTARYEKNGSNGYSCTAALLFGVVFVTLYLSIPSKGAEPGAVFMKKINAVYQTPKYSSLILFMSVLVIGCIAGNLY